MYEIEDQKSDVRRILFEYEEDKKRIKREGVIDCLRQKIFGDIALALTNSAKPGANSRCFFGRRLKALLTIIFKVLFDRLIVWLDLKETNFFMGDEKS